MGHRLTNASCWRSPLESPRPARQVVAGGPRGAGADWSVRNRGVVVIRIGRTERASRPRSLERFVVALSEMAALSASPTERGGSLLRRGPTRPFYKNQPARGGRPLHGSRYRASRCAPGVPGARPTVPSRLAVGRAAVRVTPRSRVRGADGVPASVEGAAPSPRPYNTT